MALTWLANGGFSDIQPGILPLDEMKEMIDLTAPLKPKYWRIMAAWNFIAHEADPGPSVTSPPSYGDAPYAYAPPTTRNRDWSTVDRCINEIIRRTDAEIILMVGQNRPRYGTHSGGGTSGLFGLFGGFASLVSGGLFGAVASSGSSKVTAIDYGDFAAEVAERYKPGGLGIAPDLRSAGKGVTKFEAWNEPNSKYTWVRNVDVELYVEYLKEFYNSVKAVSGLSGSASTVLFGGQTHVPQGAAWWGDKWITEQEIDFITRAYDDYGAQPYFDAMSIHPYTTQDAKSTGYSPDVADNATIQAMAIHDKMVAMGDGSKPIYITEYGFSTSMCTDTEQADFHQQAMDMVDASLPYVSMYLVYCVRDSGTNPKALNQNLGALNFDLSTTPLYALLLSMAPQEADMNLGLSLGFATTATPVRSFPIALGLNLSMAAANRAVASMNLPLTLGLGMTAAGKSTASMNLGMTLGVGAVGETTGSASMTLPLTLAVLMSGTDRQVGSFGLGMSLAMTMAGADKEAGAFALGMTLGLAATGADREARAATLAMTLGLAMTGSDKEAGAFQVGMNIAMSMDGQAPTAGAMSLSMSLGMAMSNTMSYNYAFSGSTKPAGTTATPTVVSSASASAATVTLPTHAVGDLIIVCGFRDGSATAPTADANYTAYAAPTGTTCSMRIMTRVALTTAEPNPTLTNATEIVVAVVRGLENQSMLHIDAAIATGSGTGGTITYPAATLNRSDGSDLVLRFAGQRDATNLLTNTPANYDAVNGVATGVRAIVSHTQTGTNPTADTQATNGTTGWIAATLELFAATADVGTALPTAVSSSTIREGDSDVAVNADYYAFWLYPDPMATNTYTARANSAALASGTARGMGIAVAANGIPCTKAVIGIATQQTASGWLIATWDGAAFTVRASATGSGTTVGTNDDVGIRISESGGIYTYTLQKNSVDTTLSWTDSTSIIGVPGKRWGPAFKHTRVTGVQGASPGVDQIWSADN
jgi:hypothetical protein